MYLKTYIGLQEDAETIGNEVELETEDISLDQNDKERHYTPTGCETMKQMTIISRKRLKRNDGSLSNDILEKSLRTLDEREDEYDVFGKYVANEMRNLSSVHLRRKIKRKFQQIILNINGEEEELISNAPRSVTNSYRNPSSVVTNTYYTNPSSVSSCSGQLELEQSLATYLHNETESENYETL